jgi:hypothetical protein
MVFSQDQQGNLNNSADMVFTTSAPGSQTILQIQGNSSEVSGTSNGSVVRPSIAPAGFSGVVVANGTGSVNFTPAQAGNGVYFESCCTNANRAYFKFTGSSVGNIFNAGQGQVSFTLQSQYSFAQRKNSAAAARYTFDVRDGNGTHQYYFLTQVTSAGLQFNYLVGGKTHVYYVPTGTEDELFGDGVDMQVNIAWGPSGATLSLNNIQVQSSSYSLPNPNWNASSIFDFGAFEYGSYGGYNVSDDVIINFTVAGPS